MADFGRAAPSAVRLSRTFAAVGAYTALSCPKWRLLRRARARVLPLFPQTMFIDFHQVRAGQTEQFSLTPEEMSSTWNSDPWLLDSLR